MGMNTHHQPAERAPRDAERLRRRAATGPRRSPAFYLAMVVGMLSALVLVQSSETPVQAASNVLTLSVTSARTEPMALGGAGVSAGDHITDFKYIINIDNTGTTEQNPYKADSPGGCSASDADYPDSCNWTSMGVKSSAPIYTQGDQTDFPTVAT
jgi:hypothetical protein